MRRMIVLHGVLLSLAFVVGLANGSQPAKVPRIGYLGTHTAWTGYFRDALVERNYKEGQNVAVEWRVVIRISHACRALPASW